MKSHHISRFAPLTQNSEVPLFATAKTSILFKFPDFCNVLFFARFARATLGPCKSAYTALKVAFTLGTTQVADKRMVRYFPLWLFNVKMETVLHYFKTFYMFFVVILHRQSVLTQCLG